MKNLLTSGAPSFPGLWRYPENIESPQITKCYPGRDAWRIRVIERVVRKIELERHSSIKEDLAYWLRKTPEERISAIEFLRRQYHGGSVRL
jgi:hypothetical protein